MAENNGQGHFIQESETMEVEKVGFIRGYGETETAGLTADEKAELIQESIDSLKRQVADELIEKGYIKVDVSEFNDKTMLMATIYVGKEDTRQGGKVKFVGPNDTATQSPCEKLKFHDGVVVEIGGERHILEPVEGTGRNGSCTQCSLDEVCNRFKNALCNALAGYDDDHIVLIVEDNLANDPQNPLPGEIYIDRSKAPNPDDPLMNTNVRKNAVVDYHFSDLTGPDDLGDILLGRASDRLPHVIRATEADNVFLFWSGHGGDGEGPLWGNEDARQAFGAQRLHSIVEQMQYRRMLLAVEACYSGLWGEAVSGLPDVLVLTAANAYETSKADVYDAEFRTFLSNAFARTFRAIISKEPDVLLRDLYNSLARATSGSHVSLYNIEQYGSVYNNDMSDYIVP